MLESLNFFLIFIIWISGLIFRSLDILQDGETDCWPMDCPKLNCFPVVHDAGACCPRCARPDPCATEPQRNSSSEAPSCTFKGQVMPNKHTWTPDSDNCSSCQCQVSYIFPGGNLSFIEDTNKQTRLSHHTMHLCLVLLIKHLRSTSWQFNKSSRTNPPLCFYDWFMLPKRVFVLFLGNVWHSFSYRILGSIWICHHEDRNRVNVYSNHICLVLLSALSHLFYDYHATDSFVL